MIIFEMNARVYGKRFDKIADKELKNLTTLGFDWLWVMGIWEISHAGRLISKQRASDFEGSPYAIVEYEVNPDLGGEEAFRDLVKRAHKAGLRVMADFVPNHMAVDSPLIDDHPEYFIHSHPEWRQEWGNDYFNHRMGRLAHGKDPYFAGWPDTAQLDYIHPDLRSHQIEVLKRMAELVDGVRCDMAMLILREQIKKQWYTYVDWEGFSQFMPDEFWPQAVSAAKAKNKNFVFMAEVYWDLEPYLQQLGFDLTYDKKLYDMLAHNHSPEDIARYLQSSPQEYLSRSVHFLENHDEPRAQAAFGDRRKPAAFLSFAVPGIPFVHQGEMEGFRERLPVERIKPLEKEEPDKQLQKFYAKLLSCIKDPIFRNGSMIVNGVQSNTLLLLRIYEGRAALIGVNSTGAHGDLSPSIELPLDCLGFSSGASLKCADMWTKKALKKFSVENGVFKLAPGAIADWKENAAFLLDLGI